MVEVVVLDPLIALFFQPAMQELNQQLKRRQRRPQLMAGDANKLIFSLVKLFALRDVQTKGDRFPALFPEQGASYYHGDALPILALVFFLVGLAVAGFQHLPVRLLPALTILWWRDDIPPHRPSGQVFSC